ncbi:MAG: AMP-binding protein [Halobacteriota archaeon]
MGFEPVHRHEDRPYEWVGAWTERRALLTPDAPALTEVHRDRTWTYAELDARADRTARWLADRDIGGGDRLVVIARNRVEILDLFFATGKLGAVLAPLSHRLATGAIADLVDLVQPSLLVVEDRFEGRLTDVDTDVETVVLDEDDPFTAEHANDGPIRTEPRSLADPHLLLHTGGTTGTPKETVITHGSILWNSVNTITGWGLSADDVTPMVFPFFHTGGWNVLTVPFVHMGGHLIIDRVVEPGDILEAIDRYDATVLVAAPAVLRAMSRHETWDRRDLSSLRFVKSGGGPCRPDVIAAWRERGVDLSQGYGLTECGPNNFGMPPEGAATRPDSVGRLMPHVDARVVDEEGEPVSSGEVGELELASPHAADRYWRNESETSDTFGDGWVSTGDLARIDEDDFVYIEGRIKHMYVSGGENVYPGEVESAIAEHPSVDDVVVIGVADDDWGEVGMAIVQAGERFDLETLRAFLDDRLARYKHPRHLRFVDEMPTSGPDKVDRQALRARFVTENR